MGQADDIYRRLCHEAQADRLRSLQDWREREPRVEARDRMLLSHLQRLVGNGTTAAKLRRN